MLVVVTAKIPKIVLDARLYFIPRRCRNIEDRRKEADKEDGNDIHYLSSSVLFFCSDVNTDNLIM